MKFNVFILTGLGTLLVTLIFLYSSICYSFERNIDIIWCCIGLGLIIGLLWIIIQQKSIMKDRWAKPSNLLFLSSFIVSFQWLAEDALGFNPEGLLVIPNKHVYTYSAFLGLLAIISITIGYSLGLLKKQKRRIADTRKERGWSLYLLIFLYYFFFILFIININVVDFVIGAAYSDSKEVTVYRYFEGLANYVSVAIVVQVLYNNSNTDNNSGSIRRFISILPLSYLIPLLLYMILRGMSGDRGPVITQFLMLFFAYVYYARKKFRFTTMLLAVLIVGSAISIIGIARSMSTNMAVGDKYATALSDFGSSGRFGGKSIFPPTQELALSFICTNEAVTEIEVNNEDYNKGLYQIVHTIEMIPTAPSFIRENLNLDDHRISTAGRISDGALGADRKWSLGTSMIADFYLDFGAVGVFLGCICVGFVFCWVDKVIFSYMTKMNIYYLSIALYLSSKALYMARSAFLGEFRPIFYICLFLFINRLFCPKMK